MKPKDIPAVETELGSWDFSVQPPPALLQVRFEESNTQIGYQIPNPRRYLSILARPNGFHISSQDGSKTRKDFTLPYSTITSIELLPSCTLEEKRSISIINAVAFALVAWLLGLVYHKGAHPFSLLYILSGAILGSIFSLGNGSQLKRQNLLIRYQEDNADNHILLSVDKKKLTDAIDFFSKFCDKKFSY